MVKMVQLVELADKLKYREEVSDHVAALRIAKALPDDMLVDLLVDEPTLLDREYGNVPIKKIIASGIVKHIEEALHDL